MTAALEGGEWSAARPGRTLPPGKNRHPFYRRLGGSQVRSGRAENLAPTGIRSLNHPARSQSLIPTELPGPLLNISMVIKWRIITLARHTERVWATKFSCHILVGKHQQKKHLSLCCSAVITCVSSSEISTLTQQRTSMRCMTITTNSDWSHSSAALTNWSFFSSSSYLCLYTYNNNIYKLQFGCHPVAVVILHVNKTWNSLLLDLSR